MSLAHDVAAKVAELGSGSSVTLQPHFAGVSERQLHTALRWACYHLGLLEARQVDRTCFTGRSLPPPVYTPVWQEAKAPNPLDNWLRCGYQATPGLECEP